MRNVLSFDIEEYFHVSAFSDSNPAEGWLRCESRVEQSTDYILEILDQTGTKGTFFVLGWLASHRPHLVRKIADCGHEIGSHSFWHRQVFRLSPDEFRHDTADSKRAIEDASGKPVQGYRAPSFSILKETPWAYEILAELGFTYDSSIFPVSHPNYGVAAAPRKPYLVSTQSAPIVEVPMPTVEVGTRRAPIGGGAYLRILPYWYTRRAIESLNHSDEIPVCIYAHPWEFDPQQPRMDGRLTSKIRHYVGLRGMRIKLANLVRDFEFETMGSMVERVRLSSNLN
jgi:polysaccharide deacetylase family protein (PEP-CTERM system associated)